VNIAPTNQTLILAGEQWPSIMPRAASGQVVTAAGQGRTASGQAPRASGQALDSVTIVAAGPHETLLYVRADYAPSADPALGRYTAPSHDALPSRDLVPMQRQDAPTGTSLATRSGSSSGAGLQSRPLARYAQTQGLTAAEPLIRHLDVYA
jgi:hypothetical protein